MRPSDRKDGDRAIAVEAQSLRSFLGMTAVISSDAMRTVMGFVEKIARSNAAVLITGESGTGKELVARALHSHSTRCARPWIDINCAALPDHLLESELFGYEKGAFSGAESAKPGMFELADQGTLFLDEIAELNLKSQGKMLRVLDGWPHYRLGGTRKVEVDVRIVAATNADLVVEVKAGRFRADLYHRLNQISVTVPPLRERPEDIGPLARLFLSQETQGLGISDQAVAALQCHLWPGNVRELRNLMVRLAALTNRIEIHWEDLPQELRDVQKQRQDPPNFSLDDLEQEVIFNALAQTEGRRDRAAEMLGISQRTLIRRLKEYGVRPTRTNASGPAVM
jgi:transcriptional regulator with PAS, ATPase and Fis domain